MPEQQFPVGTPVTGPHGIAEPFGHEKAPATLCAYVITAPIYHPLWSQYVLSVVTLTEMDDVTPPILKFEGATHELLVLALNPEAGHRTAEDLSVGNGLKYLLPVNIAEQFTATDEEMRTLAWLACQGVVNGQLNPETGDGPAYIREQWLTACVRTLAHLRGEEHAS